MKPASEKRMRAWAGTRFLNFQLANSGRLGPVPLWRGTGKCLAELERIYKKAIAAAQTRLGR